MTSIAHGDPCVNGCAEPRSVPAKTAGGRALLAAANARLLARRAQLALRKPAEPQQGERTLSADLPAHLGWGVAGSIKALTPQPPLPKARGGEITPIQILEKDISCNTKNEMVVVQPSLLTAMLKEKVVSIGRIYLLCRHIDSEGRGWLAIDDLRAQLTGKNSPLRVCGWRRLRQILQAGKGQFWDRDDQGRLWLYGLTRVAALQNVQRFTGDAVELPLETLLHSIGEIRGAFYAAFHSGRDSTPIARATLRDITGIAERTQRNYDDAQAVSAQSNFTLLPSTQNHEIYFEKGRAAFQFTDKLGKHGAAGTSYTAVRLPNSYQTSRFTRLSDNQKRLNKRLRQDLVKYGTQGNSSSYSGKIYFSDGAAAMKNDDNRCKMLLSSCSFTHTTFWICVNL